MSNQLDDHKMHTISVIVTHCNKTFKVKTTQSLSVHGVGHYNGYIEDENGHVVNAFSSTGGPKDRITDQDLILMFEDWQRFRSD